MERHTDIDNKLNIIFHVHIEQGRCDRRTLVNSILQVEELTFTAEAQSIVNALLKFHFFTRKNMFLLQDPVEAVAIKYIIG